MPLKPHPTDPDKMVYTRAKYNLPREWQGLTDEERMSCEQSAKGNYFALCAAIEAKLKDKNNG
jgi:hypothetical protein